MAVVRSAGWQLDEETGKKVFRVVVEYFEESDLPDWPLSVVWQKNPVKIIVTEGPT